MTKVKPNVTVSSIAVANTLATLAMRLPRTLRALDVAPTLSLSAASALGVLIHAGPLNLGKLAQYEQVTAASISKTITLLEQRGLVSRTPDQADGRAFLIQSTVLGKRLFKEGHERKLAPLVAWVEQLPEHDRRRLIDVLALLDSAAVLISPTLSA
ncbi:MAG: MarR family transcriptional regulator [Telluria sp.]